MIKDKILIITILLLLTLCQQLLAQSNHSLQNTDPIANFSLNEDDTTRYTHHYLYEQAYQLIEDMLVGQRAISIKDAEFAIENAFLEGYSFQKIVRATIINTIHTTYSLFSTMEVYHCGKNIFTITEEVSGDNVGTTFMTSSLSNAEEFFKALSIETQCYKVDGKTKETGAMFVDNIAYIMVAAQATSSIPLTSSAEKYQQYHPNAIFQILVHSHPSNGGPSGSDKSQYNKFRDVHHYIFLPALEQYVEYNDQGMIGSPIYKIIP